MKIALLTFALVLPTQTESLKSGQHTRTVTWEGAERTYHVHFPPTYEPTKPMPVILALHGASMNGRIMENFCGLTTKADQAGFIVLYPNATGPVQVLLTWNAGSFPGTLRKKNFDDVGAIAKMLDDLSAVANVDAKRVYCVGLSNGGMMAYRVAAELSERIAAVASVAGTMVCDECKPKRPVPILHFHGTKDSLVPLEGLEKPVKLRSVSDTIQAWVKANGCQNEPEVAQLPTPRDSLQVTRKTFNSGKNGAEVVLYLVEGGGHVWPGRNSPGGFLGASTFNINANDLMWEFFQKHPLK